MKSHQKTAARFLIAAFALVVLAISASTSFGFFYAYFPELLPQELLGHVIAATISGAVGVLLFDAACSIWLYTFLHHAETPEQRAVSLIMTAVTFTGGAAASVAHLSLNAGTVFVLDAAAAETVGLTSLVAVVVGVVANFGATLAYQRFSRDNKEKVRESDRMDEIQQAEDEQAKYLDSLVAKEVKDILTQQAPDLAAMQARRIAARFQRHEQAKYGGDGPPPPLPNDDQAAGNDQKRPLSEHEIADYLAQNPDALASIIQLVKPMENGQPAPRPTGPASNGREA